MGLAPRRPVVGLYYDDDAYTEPAGKRGVAAGMMGRHVAGREFLDALLRFGSFGTLFGLATSPASEATLRKSWNAAGGLVAGRQLDVCPLTEFHAKFLSNPPAPVLHFPCPPMVNYAWVREATGRPGVALSGITHTICSESVARTLCEYVTAPFEHFDALVCTSRAVVATVRRITATYCDYLADRFGGRPALRLRLEWIPLGVDVERYRPATVEERAAARTVLHATDDEVLILFVGRISFHAKAHPFPMYVAAAEAARRTGKRVHLVLAGWTANEAIDRSFRDGASVFAPGVRVSFVDGTAQEIRAAVWRAADVVALPSDNIQETFGQVVTEGLASGLPVVTTDWDGCRDLVTDGETGFLIPTYTVAGATDRATAKLLSGELNYDFFLAACNQVTAVDVGRMAEAFTRLVGDPELRRRMGAAARARAEAAFSWARVVGMYERLWELQTTLLRERAAVAGGAPPVRGPACYPAVDHTFAAYPYRVLDDDAVIEVVSEPPAKLAELLRHPLTNYGTFPHVTNAAVIGSILAKLTGPMPLNAVDALWAAAGIDRQTGRGTVGWLLKYGILRIGG